MKVESVRGAGEATDIVGKGIGAQKALLGGLG